MFQIAQMVQKYHVELEAKQRLRRQKEQQRVKQVANVIAKMIDEFWIDMIKVVFII